MKGVSDPKVVVFDLDGCVWYPEMYMLRGGSPFRVGEEGQVMDRKGERIVLLGEIMDVLRTLRRDYPHIQVGIASTCDEPEWAKELLKLIRVDEERVLHDMFHENLIEIYYAMDKSVHLKQIATKANVSTTDLIFFDNQHNNIQVAKRLSVTAIYTGEDGVSKKLFEQAIEEHKKKRAK